MKITAINILQLKAVMKKERTRIDEQVFKSMKLKREIRLQMTRQLKASNRSLFQNKKSTNF
jgi:hypothetical protein